MKTKILVLGALFASLCASVQGQTPTPLLHLSFDNVGGSTVTNDGSGGSTFDGTLIGTASVVAGGVGNCLSIPAGNSQNAYVAISNLPVSFDNSGTWSWAMWIKTTTPGGTYMYQGDGAWASANRTFYLNNGSTTGHQIGGVSYGQGWETGTTAVDDGLWHFIAMTCTNGTKTMYVDGVVDNISVDSWSANAAGSLLYIGGNGTGEGDGQVGLGGLIDEVNVYNQTLSQSDIQSLFASKTFGVPVTVMVNPASRYRGQTFTVTATATPNVGTVTNATVNLSVIGLSTNANLVQASANVFTNTFTVPATAPIVATALKVIVTSTEPSLGSSAAAFTVVALPPTNATVVTQITPASVHEYTEVSFHFATTNDAPIGTTNDVGFPMAYSWYKGGVLVSTNGMGPYYTFLTVPGDNSQSIYAVARVADTNFSSISVTSSVVTLTVVPGTPVYTNGLKREFFAGTSRQGAEIGDTVPGVITLVPQAQLPGGYGNNYTERTSGYFIPQTTDAYVFFIASDDDCDLFLSTDSNPTNKQIIAQETTWSGALSWSGSVGASVATQKRSDQWTNSVGATPYSAGINLVAGQKYYIESVHHQGGGGDAWAITYQTVAEGAPADGTASRMTAASNNIAVITWPGTSINWTLQPPASLTVNEGQSTNLSVIASLDAEMLPYYQWFIVTNGGTLPGTALTGQVANGTNTTLSFIPPSYNHAQIYCVASAEEGSLSITSSVCTLTVIQSVFEPGFVAEQKWMNQYNVAGAEAGTLGTPTITCVRAGFLAGLDNPGAFTGGDSTIQQNGYFVAPTTGAYVFFVTSHDGADLFLSTDNTPANKQLVAQEAGWSGNWAWNQAGGGGSVVSQKRSDQYSPDGGLTFPYSTGIPLVAGQRYYMEVDHSTSKWGTEQFGVTYTLTDYSTAPADGSYPNAVGTNVGMTAIRCSNVAITQQPASIALVEGATAQFSVAGTSDSQYSICSSYGYTTNQPTQKVFGQWYKVSGGVTNSIPGAVGSTLAVGPFTAADNGVQFYCAVRALGYANDALQPISTNSQLATVTVTARTTNLLGHWIGGTASLADTANYVAPGVYDGSMVGGNQSYFTNDVPPGAPSGAQSLYLINTGIAISNTVSTDPGYVVDTFDGNIQNQFTIAFWAKGSPTSWDPWVSKNGEGSGWQMRKLGWASDGRPTFTMRGSGGAADPYPSDGFDLSQWHFYAGTFDTTTGNRNLYVDGLLENQQVSQTPYTLASGSRLMIGARDNGGIGNYFTGNLYDVRVYNYALTQQQIFAIGPVQPVPPFTTAVTVDGNGNQQLQLTFQFGTLLQATNLIGPWTTNTTVSPATIPISTATPQLFFRVRYP